jgi:hypothetical protein
MKWNEMEWNRMESNGMESNEIEYATYNEISVIFIQASKYAP